MKTWVDRYIAETDAPHDAYGYAEWVTQAPDSELAAEFCTGAGYPWVDEWTDKHWEEAYSELMAEFEQHAGQRS